MKANLTYIAVVLDESGSMWGVFDDTVKGLNGFINSQRSLDGEARVTINKFSTGFVRPLVNNVPLSEVPAITGINYRPNGGTALYDAIGHTIDTLGYQLAALPEEERPERVIVVIQTDGEENSSWQYTEEVIRGKIEHQKTKYSWQFIFLGADQDAFKAAGKIGIGYGQTLSYNSANTGVAFAAATNYVSAYRSAVDLKSATVMAFAEEDREKSVAVNPNP